MNKRKAKAKRAAIRRKRNAIAVWRTKQEV